MCVFLKNLTFLAETLNILTVAKTILYWLNEYFSGFDSIGHNDAQTLLIYWIIPNGMWVTPTLTPMLSCLTHTGIWLVVPSLILRLFARDVVQGLKTGQNIGKKYQ